MTRHQGTEKHALIVFYQNLVSSMKLDNIFLKKGIIFVKNFRNVIIMDIVSEKFTINLAGDRLYPSSHLPNGFPHDASAQHRYGCQIHVLVTTCFKKHQMRGVFSS